MEKVDATHEFEADGLRYRMDVFLISGHPLVFRHEFSKRDDNGEWSHVASDDREYGDPEGNGGKDAAMIELLRREGPLMAREFLEYLDKNAKKKRKK
jgi:hypothetical protein